MLYKKVVSEICNIIDHLSIIHLLFSSCNISICKCTEYDSYLT